MTLIRTTFVAITFVLAACGADSSSSGGSVSGTVHGQSYGIQDAISSGVAVANQHEALIFLTTSTGACTEATANTVHPNQKAVLITAADITGVTATIPVAPGMYSIYQGSGSPPAKAATMQFLVEDATCTAIAADGAKATSGSVTLTGVSGNAFSGTYDVALDSGDHVTGSFSPAECPGIMNAISTNMPVCM